jgi:signal transduction histidine kinase
VLGSAAIIVYNDPTHDTGQIVLMPVLFAIAWFAGFALRERAEQAEAAETRAAIAERERDAAARIAVAEERVRIARELHDVVAHAVSVMVLQAGAVRHNLSGADRESLEALEGVEQTGRTALAEMRRLLGAMRARDDEPQFGPEPGLDRLETLLEEVRHAGLTVQLHVEGEPFPIPRAIDLSAYRIVQEGLTNVLKHAGAAHADVTLRYAPDDLRIDIHDDGMGAITGGDPGFGLVGIRERVTLYGGQMTAGSDNGGGFLLRTRLPLTGYRT